MDRDGLAEMRAGVLEFRLDVLITERHRYWFWSQLHVNAGHIR